MTFVQALATIAHKACSKVQALHLDYLILLPVTFFISSQIIIPLPFSPVPLSLQPLPVFLAAWFLGRRGVAGYAMYLIQGAFGAPIFCGFSGGLAHLLGPTGGYLFGFLIGATLLVMLRHHTMSIFQIYLAYSLGMISAFTCGVGYLSMFMPISSAIAHGLLPFIIGDFAIKPALFMIATGLKK